jgi:putative tryptophan/tyrosine transport system ATP-binding protein
MIGINDVSVVFHPRTALEMRAVRQISLAIPASQFVTIIGSNGAGKSTLLNVLAGEIHPNSGQVTVDGLDMTRWPVHRRARIISRLFQDPRTGICEHMSIVENLAIAMARTSPAGLSRAVTRSFRDQARERLAMLKLGLENRLDDRVDLLSGGQRQALSLVMATLGPTKVLLLDEHTAALDPSAADLVMQLTNQIVRAFDITTVMVTHSMRQALDFGDRIIMLHQGSVIADVSGPERAALQVDDLLRLFRRTQGTELADDQLLLS